MDDIRFRLRWIWIDSKYKLQEWKHFKCKHKTALSCIYSQDILRNFSPFSLDQAKAKVKAKVKVKVKVKAKVKAKVNVKVKVKLKLKLKLTLKLE